METKDIIDNMIDSIIDGDANKAREDFDDAIAAKLSDAMASRKLELAQSVYTKTEEDGQEA
jgi:hypothetical protein